MREQVSQTVSRDERLSIYRRRRGIPATIPVGKSRRDVAGERGIYQSATPARGRPATRSPTSTAMGGSGGGRSARSARRSSSAPSSTSKVGQRRAASPPPGHHAPRVRRRVARRAGGPAPTRNPDQLRDRPPRPRPAPARPSPPRRGHRGRRCPPRRRDGAGRQGGVDGAVGAGRPLPRARERRAARADREQPRPQAGGRGAAEDHEARVPVPRP